jgi:hypothetical protein
MNAARSKLDRLDSAKRKADHAKLLGRCFKYSNSYGGDSRWWLYIKVTGDDGYWPRTFNFQTTDRDEVLFRRNHQSHISGGGYIPIAAAEFRTELKKALRAAGAWADKVLT